MTDAKSEGSPFLVVSIGAVLIVGLLGWFGFPRLGAYLDSKLDVEDEHVDSKGLERLSDAKLTAPADVDLPGAWPQWRGPRRDGVARDTGLLASWPAEGPALLWQTGGGPGFSSLAVVDGSVFTMVQDGPNEVVLCLDEMSGKELWRQPYPAKFSNPESGEGPTSTPVVFEGKVYAVGATGLFHCLDAKDGKVLWQHDLLKVGEVANQEYGTAFSPLLEGDLVITLPGGPNGKSIAAFNRHDGKLVWQSLDDRAGFSSPVAATLAGQRQIVCVTAESILGVSPQDGKLLWRHPWPAFKDCNVATPIVAGNYVYVSTGYNKGCILLEITEADGAMQARPVYENNRMRNQFSSSILYKDCVYGFDTSFLVCMDLRKGDVLWKQRGFQRGSLTLADGRFIILGEHGNVALATLNPQGYQLLSTFKLPTQRCWTSPVIANGKLFLRDEKTIWCFNLKDAAKAE
ncbi:MAG: PQQ-binding-like beta-propeller repeat protein [Gemmataceae bacterium]